MDKSFYESTRLIMSDNGYDDTQKAAGLEFMYTLYHAQQLMLFAGLMPSEIKDEVLMQVDALRDAFLDSPLPPIMVGHWGGETLRKIIAERADKRKQDFQSSFASMWNTAPEKDEID